MSVRVLRDPGAHAIHWPWVERVRQPLTEAGLVGPDSSLLWELIPASPGYMPDFLTPAPSGLDADLEIELAAFAEIPDDVVLRDLSVFTNRPTPAVAALLADPASGREQLAAEIRAYWKIALEPFWPRIKVLLGGEVFHRARLLAEGGAGDLLNDLHERVRWEGDTLSIATRACAAPDVADGGGLVLVPSVFVWPSVASVSASEPLQVAYPARGIATLWEGPAEVTEALANLIGRGRAQILLEVKQPASTTDLARRTGMSPGGVSQHLSVLRAAGLVTAHRQGKTVFNVQTNVAAALLSTND